MHVHVHVPLRSSFARLRVLGLAGPLLAPRWLVTGGRGRVPRPAPIAAHPLCIGAPVAVAAAAVVQDEAEREEFFRLKKVQAKKAKDKALKEEALAALGVELDGDVVAMGGMVAQQADDDLLF